MAVTRRDPFIPGSSYCRTCWRTRRCSSRRVAAGAPDAANPPSSALKPAEEEEDAVSEEGEEEAEEEDSAIEEAEEEEDSIAAAGASTVEEAGRPEEDIDSLSFIFFFFFCFPPHWQFVRVWISYASLSLSEPIFLFWFIILNRQSSFKKEFLRFVLNPWPLPFVSFRILFRSLI